jgi:hypothetical protein
LTLIFYFKFLSAGALRIWLLNQPQATSSVARTILFKFLDYVSRKKSTSLPSIDGLWQFCVFFDLLALQHIAGSKRASENREKGFLWAGGYFSGKI